MTQNAIKQNNNNNKKRSDKNLLKEKHNELELVVVVVVISYHMKEVHKMYLWDLLKPFANREKEMKMYIKK